jgi:hypothetical protein
MMTGRFVTRRNGTLTFFSATADGDDDYVDDDDNNDIILDMPSRPSGHNPRTT